MDALTSLRECHMLIDIEYALKLAGLDTERLSASYLLALSCRYR